MTPPVAGPAAPRVNGKFLDVNGRRFLVKGVAYGTFAPDADGRQFPPAARVAEDFSGMAAAGINTVRTYTVPDATLLDLAAQHDLRVIVGMPWPQEVAFLDDLQLTRQIRRDAMSTVRRLASHPSVLLFAAGNEIPPAIVRWHGRHRVERFLATLYEDLKSAAPGSLFTYVNFPPTEHLELDSFDVCAFNVYLHRDADLRAYLARLQHIAGPRPLLLTEAGADSRREGPDGQARLASMQVRAAFAEGACGTVVFAWTDEWWRGGRSVEDWAFGLVDAARTPKPALAAVARTLADTPFPRSDRARWPRVSVVVCAFNAADTIDDCLTSLAALTYPHAEILVVNDGSNDETGAIARRHPGVRVIDVPNGGLGAARNVGLAEATGDIVAYTDADVRVDPDWLMYLVQPFLTSDVAGAGGPNLVPADDPWVAQCVARAPGGPTQVLLDDRIAEHVPGCNMAFRRSALLSIGGFNPVYLRAGDDVDICWRLQAKGQAIAFSPSALVWHHHRGTVGAYWRQQVGYGEGEAWLDAHHPEKFIGGQMLWRGRIYSSLPFVRAFGGRRVNTGTWGTQAFPSVYYTDAPALRFLPHTPGWMAGSTTLLAVGALGLLSPFTAEAWLLLGTGVLGWMTTLIRCAMFARRSDLRGVPQVGVSAARSRLAYRALIAWLHLLQPLARLRGRLRGMLSQPPTEAKHVTRQPWKPPVPSLGDALVSGRLLAGGGAERSFWGDTWTGHTTLLTELAGMLRASRPAPLIEIDDGWRADRDLSLAVGRWGWLHVRALVEEHAEGRCLFRVGARLRPSFAGAVQALTLALMLLGGTSASIALRWHWMSIAAVVLVCASLVRAAWHTTRAVALLDRAVHRVAASAGMKPLPERGWSRLRPRSRLRPAAASEVIQTVIFAILVGSAAATIWAVAQARIPQLSWLAASSVPVADSAAPPPEPRSQVP